MNKELYSSSGGAGFDRFRSGQSSSGSRGSRGAWVNNQHRPGPRDLRTERMLFGDKDDANRGAPGINFSKYDDIPVEVSGQNVPEPITSVCSL